MKEISEMEIMGYLKNKFPDFKPYWDEYIDDWGPDHTLLMNLLPFEKYTLDVIKNNNQLKIAEIFDCVEDLLTHGDEIVQNTIATGFLEYLLNKSYENNEVEAFKKFLGKQALAYIEAWIKFIDEMEKGTNEKH